MWLRTLRYEVAVIPLSTDYLSVKAKLLLKDFWSCARKCNADPVIPSNSDLLTVSQMTGSSQSARRSEGYIVA